MKIYYINKYGVDTIASLQLRVDNGNILLGSEVLETIDGIYRSITGIKLIKKHQEYKNQLNLLSDIIDLLKSGEIENISIPERSGPIRFGSLDLGYYLEDKLDLINIRYQDEELETIIKFPGRDRLDIENIINCIIMEDINARRLYNAE